MKRVIVGLMPPPDGECKVGTLFDFSTGESDKPPAERASAPSVFGGCDPFARKMACSPEPGRPSPPLLLVPPPALELWESLTAVESRALAFEGNLGAGKSRLVAEVKDLLIGRPAEDPSPRLAASRRAYGRTPLMHGLLWLVDWLVLEKERSTGPWVHGCREGSVLGVLALFHVMSARGHVPREAQQAVRAIARECPLPGTIIFVNSSVESIGRGWQMSRAQRDIVEEMQPHLENGILRARLLGCDVIRCEAGDTEAVKQTLNMYGRCKVRS